jgi:hypothetical protein
MAVFDFSKVKSSERLIPLEITYEEVGKLEVEYRPARLDKEELKGWREKALAAVEEDGPGNDKRTRQVNAEMFIAIVASWNVAASATEPPIPLDMEHITPFDPVFLKQIIETIVEDYTAGEVKGARIKRR